VLIFLVGAALAADGFTVRGGVHVAPYSHGVGDVVWTRSPWTVGFYSDTLEVRWGPSRDRGRSWVAARGEYGAAGLLISPWTDGEKDPARARRGSYAGVDAGSLRYGPLGLYAGVQGSARWWMVRGPDSPPDHAVLGGDALLGVWRPGVQGWVRLGADLEPGVVDGPEPHAQGELVLDPGWAVSPRVEGRAAVAANQSDLTRTRVGGLNPYVVPVAGAGWAEWWAEDYVALRSAGVVRVGEHELAAFADLAWMEDLRAGGLGASTTLRKEPWKLELAVGHAPRIPRGEEVSRWTGWVRASYER
jgi:hypothetical protein